MAARADPPAVGCSLRRSWSLFRARPAAALALGVAIVLSLVSVCCGIGAFTAPWFLCELSALQLAEGTGQPVPRSRAWFAAACVLAGAVLLTSSVAWLSLLGLGAEAAAVNPPLAARDGELLGGGVLLAGAAALVAVVFVLPLLYSALLLIEARTTLGGAALESARLVARDGWLAHLKLSLAANLLQFSPLLPALLWVADEPWTDPSPVTALATLPLLALSVPLGQGMIASAYLERRTAVVETRSTRAEGRPSPLLVAVWVALVIAPLVSFGSLGVSLARPSRLPRGRLPAQVELLGEQTLRRGPLQLRPAGTALTISATQGGVDVVASDGGGAGRLPLRGRGPLERARVGRVRSAYGIELLRGGHAYIGWVSAAGVRLDDGLRARLTDRLPPWVLLAMLGALLATASLLLPVLNGLAEVRRAYAEGGANASVAAACRRRAVRRARWAAALLLPLSLLSLCGGVGALLQLW